MKRHQSDEGESSSPPPIVHCRPVFTVVLPITHLPFLSLSFSHSLSHPFFFLSLLFVFFCFVFCTSVSRVIELTVRVAALVARFISVVLSHAARYPASVFPPFLLPLAFVCLVVWGISGAHLWLGPQHLFRIFRFGSYRPQ